MYKPLTHTELFRKSVCAKRNFIDIRRARATDSSSNDSSNSSSSSSKQCENCEEAALSSKTEGRRGPAQLGESKRANTLWSLTRPER